MYRAISAVELLNTLPSFKFVDTFGNTNLKLFSSLMSGIRFVKSHQNAAEGLTKAMSQAALQEVIRNEELMDKTDQWVIGNA